ncbi:MAG TPA: hypothetical protein VHF06_33545 [Pseudonocardiaceae bacterium]|jgi:predicted lipoprotein with Yx(FWY)xxD motif|nr:hypothetical protein [Pseudonocardiaceae bacterium]
MHLTRSHLTASVTVGLGVLLSVAACGTPSSSAPATGGGPTVSVRGVDGMSVLVDQAGAALYTNDQEAGASLRCVSAACTAIWAPLTVPAGHQPTAASTVGGTIGTVQRPDGSHQVTLDGKPLYTFSFDHGAGRVTGNGTQDSFSGTDFTWHSAVASGGAATGGQPPASGSGYAGGY